MKIRTIALLSMTALIWQCSPKSAPVSSSSNEKQVEMKREKVSDEEFRNTPPEAAPAPKIQLGEYRRFELENGLEVIVVENHKLPKVSFQLYVDRPPVEEGDQTGYVEITGNLLKSGTANRTKEAIDEEVDFIGANLSTNSKGFYASCLTHHKETLMEVLSDIVLQPSFPKEEFDKAVKQKLSAIAASQNDPSSIASDMRDKVNFGGHPYGEFATEETVKNIDLESCKAYYENYFLPNHSYLVFVGDIKAEEARELSKKYFGDWKKGDLPQQSFKQPALPDTRQVVFVDLPSAVQSVINITHPADLSMGSEDYIAASVMNHILGGGVFSGYLMQNLREDKGYTYGARSQLSSDPYIGYFNAYANVGNDVTDSAVVEFLREMNRIRNEKVDEEHLELVKNSMEGSFARSLEKPQNIAQQALAIVRFNLPEDFFKTYLQQIESVTAEEVQNVARKYIHPANCNILVIGNKDAVADKLERFDGDRSISFYTPDGKRVDMEKAELPEGVTAQYVIGKYIDAIGGKERLKKVNSLIWKVNMNLMSMEMEGTRYIVRPDKYADISKVNGMEVRKMVYNAGEGYNLNPRAGRQAMDETDLIEAKLNAQIFKELHYEDLGYSIELEGIAKVEGEEAYKLSVRHGEDHEIHEFYSIGTGFKLKEITTIEGPNGPLPVTTLYKEYQEFEGILFPSVITVAGPFPEPMKMETTAIELNPEIDESVFQIDGNGK